MRKLLTECGGHEKFDNSKRFVNAQGKTLIHN